jgi:hypothetical protein
MLLSVFVCCVCLTWGAAAALSQSPALDSSGPVAGGAASSQTRLNLLAWEDLAQVVFNHYANRDVTGVNWRGRFHDYGAPAAAAVSTEEWMKVAGDTLAASNDPGIRLEYRASSVDVVKREPAPDWNDAAILREFPDTRHVNGALAFGFAADGVGYLSVSSLEATDRAAFDDLSGIIDLLRRTRGLVMDLRGVTAGSESLASRLAAWFTDKQVVYALVSVRDPSAPDGWRGPLERKLDPTSTGIRYNRPLAVLIGRHTAQGGEALALMLKASGARLVGAPTAGRWGNEQPWRLTNDATVYLASWQVKLLDGSLLYGKGVQPDVLVDPGSGAFDASDPVLERALELVR